MPTKCSGMYWNVGGIKLPVIYQEPNTESTIIFYFVEGHFPKKV